MPLELIYADVWGPVPIVSINGDRFFVNFVDDFSRFNWPFLIPVKSCVCETFIKFKSMIENQLNLKIKQLQTDNGGEFLALRTILKKLEIVH